MWRGSVWPSGRCGPGSVVGLATGYLAGRSRDRIPAEARFSAPVQTGPVAHPSSCTMSTGSFPGVKSGRAVTLSTYPLLVPWSKKEQSYTSTPPIGRTACTETQCLYKGTLYLYLYLTLAGTAEQPDIFWGSLQSLLTASRTVPQIWLQPLSYTFYFTFY